MSLFGTTPIGGPGDGIFPPAVTGINVKLTSATGRPVGACVALDIANATTGLSTSPGGVAGTSIFNTVRDVAAGQSAFGYPVCILEAAIATGGTGKVTFHGIVVASVTAGAAAGDLLTIDTTNFNLKKAAGATDRVAGYMCTAIVSGTATVFFNGFCNLGGPVLA
jgi:hypothetical protein